MASPAKVRRISVKLKSPNPLFERWLTEWRDKAKEKESKMQFTFANALKTLKKYPLPLESGRDCIILKGFGKKLCEMLDGKMFEHKQTRDDDTTTNSNNRLFTKSPTTKMAITLPKVTNKKEIKPPTNRTAISPKSAKPYVPAERSGGYAILLALFLKPSKESHFSGVMTKDEIIDNARDLCDKSFIKPDTGSFYTAWSTMSTLINKGLVSKNSSPAKFSLTENGKEVAIQLFEMNHSSSNTTAISTTKSDINKINSNVVEFYSKTVSSDSQEFVANHLVNTEICSTAETIVFTPFSFDVILLIDTQETAGNTRHAVDDETLNELQKLKVHFEVRHLKVGDFSWICREKYTKYELILPYIVERKRMDDLGHSIKDGRFHEQKFRLKQCGIQHLIYIVESYKNNNKRAGLPLSSLMQGATNTLIQDNFQLKFTENHRHSMQYLSGFTDLLKNVYENKTLMSCAKDNVSQSVLSDDFVSLMTFADFNKNAAKVRSFKVHEIFIRQLLQLKGVSVEKALAIVGKYPTPKVLKEEYDKLGRLGEKLLSNIQYGQLKRSIGPALSYTVHQLYTLSQFP